MMPTWLLVTVGICLLVGSRWEYQKRGHSTACFCYFMTGICALCLI